MKENLAQKLCQFNKKIIVDKSRKDADLTKKGADLIKNNEKEKVRICQTSIRRTHTNFNFNSNFNF